MNDGERAAILETRRLPGRVQRVLRELQAEQSAAGKTEDPQPLLRRIERDDVVYLPEVGRGRTPLRVLIGFLVPLAFVALVFAAIAWITAQVAWALALAGTFVGCLALAIGLSLVEGALDGRRRRGTDRYGLVLTPGAMILWGPRTCRLAPRDAVVRLVAERRGGRSGGYRECVDVLTKDGEQRWTLHPRQNPALRRSLGRWHRDERPWVSADPVQPGERRRPPRPDA